MTQIVLGFCAAIVVGDWTVGWIDLPGGYTGRNVARDKLALYETQRKPPDVVFLGTSHEWCGIDPETVDAAARTATGVSLQSLNLASSAASTVTSFLLARRLVKSDQPPWLVYLGISPAVSDANETDTMRNGLRALGEFRDLPRAWSCDPRLIGDVLATSLLASYYRWDDIRALVRRLVIGAPIRPSSRLHHTARGWARWSDPPRPLPRRDPPPVGPVALARIAGGFLPRGPLAEALKSTIDELRDAGIEVRLLEIPVTTIAAPWARPQSNPPYRAMVERIARITQTKVVRVPDGFMSNEDYFDPVHLHAGGARKLSRWLARDVAAAIQERRGVDGATGRGVGDGIGG